MDVHYVSPKVEVWDFPTREEAIAKLNKVARICYKSKVPEDFESQCNFIRTLVNNGHTAMIEHINGTFHYICSRSCANAIVRHRIASYAQESTVYCNYTAGRFSNTLVCINPSFLQDVFRASNENVHAIHLCNQFAANKYEELLLCKTKLPLARQVLPLGLKTEVVQTINLRSLLNFFQLRTAEIQNPEICFLARQLHAQLNAILPEVFERYSTSSTPLSADCN